jgi:hypothetical protein
MNMDLQSSLTRKSKLVANIYITTRQLRLRAYQTCLNTSEASDRHGTSNLTRHARHILIQTHNPTPPRQWPSISFRSAGFDGGNVCSRRLLQTYPAPGRILSGFTVTTGCASENDVNAEAGHHIRHDWAWSLNLFTPSHH